MKDYLAAVDLGTTGVRCSLFDLDGNMSSMAYKEYELHHPSFGFVEQDLPNMIEETFAVCREATSQYQNDVAAIRAITFSAQRACFCAVNKQGNLVRPMISWQDTRTLNEVNEIMNLISEDEFSSRTGLPLSTVNLLSKILWMQKHEPILYEQIDRIVQCQDILLRAFGVDQWLTDLSCAAFYGLWNVRQKHWDETLLHLFGMDRTFFGEPERSGKIVGSIGSSVAQKSGFAEGTPICLGAGDQNCSVLGMGSVRNGMATITLGTAGLAILSTNDPRSDLPGMICTNHIVPDLWCLEGLSNVAASSLNWLRNILVDRKITSDSSIWSQLEKEATESDPGGHGLLFLPYLAGSATPHWNPGATGSLLGLTLSHNRGDIVRAIMEGVVFEINEMLHAWKKVGLNVGTIRLGGGATRNTLWNRIQADIYGCPVETVKQQETAAIGAALIAGCGIGLFSSIEDAAKAMIHVDRIIEPDPKNHIRYSELFQLFTDTYSALEKNGIHTRLNS